MKGSNVELSHLMGVSVIASDEASAAGCSSIGAAAGLMIPVELSGWTTVATVPSEPPMSRLRIMILNNISMYGQVYVLVYRYMVTAKNRTAFTSACLQIWYSNRKKGYKYNKMRFI
jgi:hypothetical protein